MGVAARQSERDTAYAKGIIVHTHAETQRDHKIITQAQWMNLSCTVGTVGTVGTPTSKDTAHALARPWDKVSLTMRHARSRTPFDVVQKKKRMDI